MTLKQKLAHYRDLVKNRNAKGTVAFLKKHSDDLQFIALIQAQKKLAASMRRSQIRNLTKEQRANKLITTASIPELKRVLRILGEAE